MNPLEQHNDLPLAVRKRLDYFPQLLARLVGSPIWDTYEILDEALTHYKAGEDDLSQGQKFIARLKHYLEPTPMDAERQERIESWAFSTQRKEAQILNDFEMPEWRAVVTEADRATLENRLHIFGTTGRRIDQLDKDLDSDGANAANTERHIAQIEKRLAELNAAPATTEPPQPGSQALDTPAPSPWRPLLTGLLELPALFEFFADCELLTPAGELTALGRADGQNKARKAPWAGTLQALIQSRHLDGNPAAICRAMSDPAGGIKVSLNEGTLRDYSAKAETYLALANGYLEKRGILRK